MTGGWPALRAAAADRASGAAAIARAAGEALLWIEPCEVEAAVVELVRRQPAMAPVWRLATDALSALDAATGRSRDHRGAVRAFLAALGRDRQAGRRLAPVLPDRLLTISRSSLVAEAIRARRPAEIRCMESLPGGEGRTMAEELRTSAAVVEVVPDGEALASLPADAVVCGADAVTPQGLANKMGTRALAESARARGVPCYAAAGETKFLAEPLPLAAAFERVPLALFAAIATPDGLLPAEEAARLAGRRPLHPRLRALALEARREASRPGR